MNFRSFIQEEGDCHMKSRGIELEFTENEKRNMLKSQFPDLDMEEKRECIHCGAVIRVGDFRVKKYETFLMISCPDIDCDGTPLDWMPLHD